MSKSKIKKIIENPLLLFMPLLRLLTFYISDKYFIIAAFFIKFKRIPNLKHPKTYNEKIQWLKLNDKKSIYSKLADKSMAKKIVGDIIGENHIIKTLGIWDSYDAINFDTLPDQFVLKTTHDSGTVLLCKDKKSFDFIKAKKRLNKSLKSNFYWVWREWPYKNIKPRIIAEELISDSNSSDLKDYKFFCFNGIPKVMYIASNRSTNTTFDFYDMDFNHLPIINGYDNSKENLIKPKNFETMISLAKEISRDFTHVRVDFYNANDNVFFGEITFYHWSGMVPFEPKKWDRIFGDLLIINDLNNQN